MDDAAGTIRVTLFAGLESRARERSTTYEFDPRVAATVSAVADAVGLEPGAVGLILVNGIHAAPAQGLRPGDAVSLFPSLGGG